MSTVLVLGGGVGGLVAAAEVRRRLGREHRVVLLDREGTHAFQPSYVWVLTGRREPRRIVRDLSFLTRRGIDVVRAEVQGIDPARREVRTTAGAFAGDFLVVSLGADLDPGAVSGLAEAGETFYTLPGAQRLHRALQEFPGGRVVVLIAGVPFKCPAAPYEAALLMESFLRRRGVRAELDIYTPEKQPMPVAGPAVGGALRDLIERRGIRYHPEHQVREVRVSDRWLVFENGVEAPFDLLAHVPPHRPARVAREAGLGDGGWIPVDPGTLATRYPGVFAIGDAVAIKLPSGAMLPKAGVFAHAEAKVVAANIAASIAGRTGDRRFDGHGQCWVESGDGRAAFGSGDFYASPAPQVVLRPPSRFRHWTKVAFEKSWLWRWS